MDLNMTTVWTAILVVGVGTFTLRYSLIRLLGKADGRERLQRVLRFVPPAVMAAMVTANLSGGGAEGGGDINRLIALGAAALVAWRTKSILYTILAGFVVLAILTNL